MHFKLGGVPCTYSGRLTPTSAPGSREERSSLLSTHLGSLITEFTMEAVFIVLVSSFMHTLKLLRDVLCEYSFDVYHQSIDLLII